MKDILDIDYEKLATMYVESNKTLENFIEEIVSTGIPQSVRPEKIAKNAYNFPNDDWNKSKDKRDIWKYTKKKKEDSVAFQPAITVSNY